MTLTLNLGDLKSRIVRNVTTDGGIRKFAVGGLDKKQDDEGNPIGNFINGFAKGAGFLIGGALSGLWSGLSWTLSGLWGLGVSAFQFTWNFNWNISDREIDAEIGAAWKRLGLSVAGALGNAVGWLACGALPGTVIAAFNEPLGLYVLEQVGEEAFDELCANLGVVVKQTFATAGRSSAYYLYKNLRNLWREPDSRLKDRLIAQGVKPDDVQRQIAERNKPWSFSSGFQDFLETLPGGEYLEEFVDEFSESCIEAGYVVTQSIDSYMAMQKVIEQDRDGAERTVEIQFNRSLDD
jgi:hypothetical protein